MISSSSFTRPEPEEHDVYLLGVLVPVREGNALVGLDALMSQAGVACLEIAAREAGLLNVTKAELGRGVSGGSPRAVG